jgi:hypothetical protein
MRFAPVRQQGLFAPGTGCGRSPAHARLLRSTVRSPGAAPRKALRLDTRPAATPAAEPVENGTGSFGETVGAGIMIAALLAMAIFG